jgi:hypothetical protein
MKYLLAVCCLLAFVSCDDHSKPAAKPSQQTILKDSNIIKKEAANPYVQVDISPMDMAYLPSNYPVQKMSGEAKPEPVARVIYSRPHRGGRQLFGGLVKWGQPWRLGANEATEIRFFQPVTIQKKRIQAGQYILYAIPYEDRWKIIFNRNLYSWGLKFDPAADVYQFEVPAITRSQMVEHFTMTFDETNQGAELIIAWENVEVRLPIQY